jgi:hypothetical protein
VIKVNQLEEMISKKADELLLKKEQDAQMPKIEQQEQKSFKEQAKDFVGAMAVNTAINDEALVNDLAEKAKEELSESAQANLKQERAKNKQADTDLQNAEYGVFEGVANYAGIKKPLPNKMQKVLFSILAIIQTIFLIVLGTPISIINIFADCIDSVIKKLASIAKSSVTIVLAFLALAAIWAILSLLKQYGIINF